MGQASHVQPPEGAPNVLLVLIDDAGFGNPSTFGGPIDTPNYTRMAEKGLRYNRFHVTALCSPTRAALLTGRNNHGLGLVWWASSRLRSRATRVRPARLRAVSGILQDNGYLTGGFGKWHLTPDTSRASRDRLTAGRPGWGSITSGGSSAGRPASMTP